MLNDHIPIIISTQSQYCQYPTTTTRSIPQTFLPKADAKVRKKNSLHPN